jgi:hypothetical protein
MRWVGRRVSILLVVVAASVAVVAGSAAAGSEASHAASSVLDLKFRSVVRFVDGHCSPLALTSGRYALVPVASANTNACASRFVLIDDRTDKRTVIHTSGLTELNAFGAPWIFFTENGSDVLYNIATKKTRSCGPSGCVPQGGDNFAYALGRRWLETFVQQPGPCGDGVHNECGPVTQSFYNIKTGRFRHGPPADSTTIADLGSRRLFRRACSPLQVPAGGTLTFYGSFAVATQADQSSLLERCGGGLQMPIGVSSQGGPPGEIVANTHAVLWQVVDQAGAWHGQFAGVFLPSLRRFTATLPSDIPITDSGAIALTAFRVYVVDDNGRLWAAAIPR